MASCPFDLFTLPSNDISTKVYRAKLPTERSYNRVYFFSQTSIAANFATVELGWFSLWRFASLVDVEFAQSLREISFALDVSRGAHDRRFADTAIVALVTFQFSFPVKFWQPYRVKSSTGRSRSVNFEFGVAASFRGFRASLRGYRCRATIPTFEISVRWNRRTNSREFM